MMGILERRMPMLWQLRTSPKTQRIMQKMRVEMTTNRLKIKDLKKMLKLHPTNK